MRKLTLQELSDRRLRPASAREAERLPIYVLLDNVRSLHNVGAVFRTADALRVKEVILTGFTGCPPRKEISKTALGADETVPWAHYADAVEPLEILKNKGVQIVALEQTHDSVEHWEPGYQSPCCLIVGNEVFGVREELLVYADISIEIPMFGSKHSLNAAVAFGIAGYEILRQLKLGE